MLENLWTAVLRIKCPNQPQEKFKQNCTQFRKLIFLGTLHIDITGKLSGKSDQKGYVIVQVDAFTEYVFLSHSLTLDSESCINAVQSSVSLFGVPKRIIVYQGRCSTGAKFSQLCSDQKINLHLIATGASRANGQVERTMITLKNMLQERCTNASLLQKLLGKVARPLGLLQPSNVENDVELSNVRAQAEKIFELHQLTARYDLKQMLMSNVVYRRINNYFKIA